MAHGPQLTEQRIQHIKSAIGMVVDGAFDQAEESGIEIAEKLHSEYGSAGCVECAAGAVLALIVVKHQLNAHMGPACIPLILEALGFEFIGRPDGR